MARSRLKKGLCVRSIAMTFASLLLFVVLLQLNPLAGAQEHQPTESDASPKEQFHTSHVQPQARSAQQVQASAIAKEAAPTNTTAETSSQQNQTRLSNRSQQVANQTNSSSSSSLSNIRNRWRRMELAIGQSVQLFAQDFKQTLDELLQDKRTAASQLFVSNQCRLALDELVGGLMSQKLWAAQMLDSSALRLPVGLLEGTLTDLGNFDECLSIGNQRHRLPTATTGRLYEPKFSGQYCSLLIKPPLIQRPRLHTACRRLPSLSSSSASNQTIALMLSQNSHQFYYAGLRLGLCVPSKCSQADVQHLATIYLNKYELTGQVKSCQQQQQQTSSPMSANSSLIDFVLGLDALQRSILIVFLIVVCLNLVGTLLDSRHTAKQRRKQALINLLLANSLKDHQQRARPFVDSSLSSASSSSCSPLGEQQHQQRTKRNKDKKSWNYQVYCGSETTCFSSDAPDSARAPSRPSTSPSIEEDAADAANAAAELDLDRTSIGPQQNPLSDEFMRCDMELRTRTRQPIPGETPKGAPRPSVGAGGLQAAKVPLPSDVKIQFDDQMTRNLIDCEPGLNGHGGSGACGRRLKSILICFSLTNNLRSIGKFSSTSPASSASVSGAGPQDDSMTDIKVIHGLRTIAMMWIIFGHTIGLVNPEMMNNLIPLANLSCSSRLLQALLNATLAVNTFFMISGLVTVVSFARKCNSARALISAPDDRAIGGAAQAVPIRPATTTCGTPKARKNSAVVAPRSQGLTATTTTTGAISDFEISSIDSSNSIITSLSSSASSDRCIGNQKSKGTGVKALTSMAKQRRPSAEMGAGQPPVAEPWWPGDFQPLTWLVARYLRLTPAYAAVIGLSVLLPQLGSGPFWPETIQPLGANCRSNWWLNLLYVNNFFETDKLCLIHSWYLSNDCQFFIMAVLLFAAFYRSKKLAILLVVTACLASSAMTFVVTVANDFPPTIVTTSPAVAERWQFIHMLYYKPWPHVSSYLVGLVAGYMILVRDRIQLGAGWRLACWLLFSLIALAVLNSIYPWNMGLPVDPMLTGLHSATFRTLWSCCCAWLVFALVTRPRHPLALFLTWRGFQFTSRLTYCAYLVHPLIIYYNFGVLRERLDSSVYTQINRVMAMLLMSYLFALLFSLLIESPIIQLQQLLISSVLKSRKINSAAPSNSKDHPQMSSSSTSLTLDEQRQFLPTKLNGKYNYTSRQDGASKRATHDGAAPHPTWASQDTKYGSAVDQELLAKSLLAGSESYKFLLSNRTNLIDSSRLYLGLSDVNNNIMKQSGCGRQDQSVVFDENNNKRPVINRSSSNSCRLHSSSPSLQHHDINRSAMSEDSAIALDEDFQMKLAQAIGRGFKIRSKIANGTIRSPNNPQTTKRFGPARRFPATINQQRASLSPIFNSGKDHKTILRSTANKRRGDNCGTFVPASGGVDKNSRPDCSGNKVVERQCHLHQPDRKPSSHSSMQDELQNCNSKPMYLNEMLLISRQRLNSRSHNNPNSDIEQ